MSVYDFQKHKEKKNKSEILKILDIEKRLENIRKSLVKIDKLLQDIKQMEKKRNVFKD